jgi:hypothetical protein
MSNDTTIEELEYQIMELEREREHEREARSALEDELETAQRQLQHLATAEFDEVDRLIHGLRKTYDANREPDSLQVLRTVLSSAFECTGCMELPDHWLMTFAHGETGQIMVQIRLDEADTHRVGMVLPEEPLSRAQIEALELAAFLFGIELIRDKNGQLVDAVPLDTFYTEYEHE